MSGGHIVGQLDRPSPPNRRLKTMPLGAPAAPAERQQEPPFPVGLLQRERALGMIAVQVSLMDPQEAVGRLTNEFVRICCEELGRDRPTALALCDHRTLPVKRQVEILSDLLAFQVIRALGPAYRRHLVTGDWLSP